MVGCSLNSTKLIIAKRLVMIEPFFEKSLLKSRDVILSIIKYSKALEKIGGIDISL